MNQKNEEVIENDFDPILIHDGPIVEADQDKWWLEGKSRIKIEKKFLETPRGKITIVGVILVVFILLIALLGIKGSGIITPEEPTNDEPLSQANYSPLQEQIIRIRSQLVLADPVNRDIPLPQLEMSITITQE